MSLLDLIPHRDVIASHRPWPRAVVDKDGWQKAIEGLAAGKFTLLGFWGETATVHLGLLGDSSEIAVVSLECTGGGFASVAAHHAPALRLERTICELFGLQAVGATDTRPWLDHGAWGEHSPCGKKAPP